MRVVKDKYIRLGTAAGSYSEISLVTVSSDRKSEIYGGRPRPRQKYAKNYENT